VTLGYVWGYGRVAERLGRPSGMSPETQKPRSDGVCLGLRICALGGIRTPNLLIRSQMLYPLSYERRTTSSNDTWRGRMFANRPQRGRCSADAGPGGRRNRSWVTFV
jgi:hypothetical protein